MNFGGGMAGSMKTMIEKLGGVRGIMMKGSEDPGADAPAEVVADIITAERADIEILAAEYEADVDFDPMDPHEAAEIMESMVGGDMVPLVEVFAELEEARLSIIREQLSEEEFAEYSAAKTSVMYSSLWSSEDGEQSGREIPEQQDGNDGGVSVPDEPPENAEAMSENVEDTDTSEQGE